MADDFKTQYASIPARYPELTGQVAMITGGASGIGRGIAMRMAREGMRLFLVDYDVDKLAATADDLASVGATVATMESDLSKRDVVDSVFSHLEATYGAIHMLVNNVAGMGRVSFLDEHTDLLDYQLDLNLRQPYLAAQRAGQMMKDKNPGSIINISSVGGTQAHNPGLPYDVTKGGIDMLTRAMGVELAADGIRVNAIAPGAIASRPNPERDRTIAPRIPANRIGQTLDIGAAVAFLASPDASYINGTILYVDGGITAQLHPPGLPI